MSAMNTTGLNRDDDPRSPYDYTPTEAVCIAFVVLFSIATIAHVFESVILMRKRGLWLFPTIILCGAGEILGWSGRLWSSVNVLNANAFLIQIVCLIISPTPLLAAVFMISARVIVAVGPRYSRLSPKNYSRIFLSFDVIALVVQAAGGALATSSVTTTAKLGGHIMLAGIVLSLVSITVFSICVGEFFYRYLNDMPLHQSEMNGSVDTLASPIRRPMAMRLQLMITGMLLATLFLFIRGIYRTAELSHGFNSKIMTDQVTFDLFDGGMVTLALYTLNFLHPGMLLRPEDENKDGALDKSSFLA